MSDIHTKTAAIRLGIAEEDVTIQQRWDYGKVANFAALYGNKEPVRSPITGEFDFSYYERRIADYLMKDKK